VKLPQFRTRKNGKKYPIRKKTKKNQLPIYTDKEEQLIKNGWTLTDICDSAVDMAMVKTPSGYERETTESVVGNRKYYFVFKKEKL